jgi:hypothetical protein
MSTVRPLEDPSRERFPGGYSFQQDRLAELLQPITAQLKEYERLPDTNNILAELMLLVSLDKVLTLRPGEKALQRLMRSGEEAVQTVLDLQDEPSGFVETMLRMYRNSEAVPLAVRWIVSKEADLQSDALSGLRDMIDTRHEPVLDPEYMSWMEPQLREAIGRMLAAAPWTVDVVGPTTADIRTTADGIPARVAWYQAEAGTTAGPADLAERLNKPFTAARQVAMLLYRLQWYHTAADMRRRGAAPRVSARALSLFGQWTDPQSKWSGGQLVRGQMVLATLDPESQGAFLDEAAFTIAGSAGKLYPEVLAWAINKGHELWYAELPTKGRQRRVDVPQVVGGWPALYREITGRKPGTRDGARLHTVFQALRAGRMPNLPKHIDGTLLSYQAADGHGRGNVGSVDVTLNAMCLPDFQSLKGLPEEYRLTQPMPPWPGGGAFVLGATHLEAGERWLWIYLAQHFQKHAPEALRLSGVRLGAKALDNLTGMLRTFKFTRGNVEACLAGWVEAGSLEPVAPGTYRLTDRASWRHIEDLARLKADRSQQARARRDRSLGRTKEEHRAQVG